MKTSLRSIISSVRKRHTTCISSYACISVGILSLSLGTARAVENEWYPGSVDSNAESGIFHQTFYKYHESGQEWAFWHIGPDGQGVGDTFVPALPNAWWAAFNRRSVPATGQAVCQWTFNDSTYDPETYELVSQTGALAIWIMANQGNVLNAVVHGPHLGWDCYTFADGTAGRTWVNWSRDVYDAETEEYLGREQRIWLVNADGAILVEIPLGPFEGWWGYPIGDGKGGIIVQWEGPKKFAHWKFDENGQATGSHYYDIP